RTHIVKLGEPSEVSNDYDGWQKCVTGRNRTSRIFVTVQRHQLAAERVAIVYQDAFTLFPTEDRSAQVLLLEDLTREAILTDTPPRQELARSVERVLI